MGPCSQQKLGLASLAIASAVGVGWAGPVVAQTLEYCPPYGLLERPAIDPGEGFLAFALRVEQVGARKRVRVTGDRLQLNQSRLGSLIRAAARYDPSLADIVIDAREVEVEEGLSVHEGNITLMADRVTFGPGGVLTLLPNDQSSLSIIARSLSLPEGRFGHFDVRVPAAQPTGLTGLPGTQPVLTITGENLFIGDKLIESSAAVDRLKRRFTLHRLEDFGGRIGVQLGVGGRDAWLTVLEASSEWPPYTAAVWTSGFALNPFDEAANQSLKDSIERYRPVLARRPAKERTGYLVSTLLAAMQRGADLEGNGPAWATTLPLSRHLDEISSFSLDTGRGLATIDQLILLLEKARDQTQPDTSALVSATEDKLNAATVEYDQATIRLGEIENDLTQRVAALERLQRLYAEREDRLRRHAEDLKKSAELRSQIVSGLATAASIAATAYTGNPQTGAVAGGIVLAVGNMQGGKPAIQSLSDGYRFSVAIKDQLQGASAAISSLREARDQYKSFIRSAQLNNIIIEEQIEVPVKDPKPNEPATRTVKREEALADIGKRGEKLSAALQGIFDVYTKFKPEPAPIPPVLEEDGNLKEQAKGIAAALADSKAITLELDALQRRSQSLQTTMAGAAERLAQLNTVDVTNEEGRRALVDFSMHAIRDEMNSFVRAALDVRRLSLVEYAEPLPIDQKQLLRLAVSEQTSQSWDPASAKDQRELLTKYIEHIKERRNAIKLTAIRTTQAADTQFHSYIGRRGTGPIVSYPEQQITSSSRSPAAERLFIKQVNEAVRDQYRLIRRRTPEARSQLVALQNRRIAVPFKLENALPVRFPVRLLDASVTEVRRRGTVGGGDMVFSVDVERVGNFRTRGRFDRRTASLNTQANAESCFSVDLRSKESTPEQYFKTADFVIGDIDAGRTQPPRQDVSFWYLNSSDVPDPNRTMFITYPPAAARMYVRVRLDPDAVWRDAPSVEALTLKLRVFE